MGLNDIIFVPLEKDSNLKTTITENVASNEKEINIEQLLDLAKNGHFQAGALHEFLEKYELQLCSTPLPTRNPELEERVAKLKADQANKEYRSMTKYLSPGNETTNISALRDDVKSASRQITAVINFVLTVGGSFFFTYKAVEYALPTPNIPAQVLTGIVTSTVVALADLFFLLRTI